MSGAAAIGYSSFGRCYYSSSIHSEKGTNVVFFHTTDG